MQDLSSITKVINGLDLSCSQNIGEQERWSNSINYLKWCNFRGWVLWSIITILCPCEPITQSLWLFLCDAFQILLQGSVDKFCLAIRLWVIAETYLVYISLQLKYSSPKCTCKNLVSITHNWCQYTIQMYYGVNKGVYHQGCLEWMLEGYKVCILREAIYNYHNHSIIVRRWKTLDEAHWNLCQHLL